MAAQFSRVWRAGQAVTSPADGAQRPLRYVRMAPSKPPHSPPVPLQRPGSDIPDSCPGVPRKGGSVLPRWCRRTTALRRAARAPRESAGAPTQRPDRHRRHRGVSVVDVTGLPSTVIHPPLMTRMRAALRSARVAALRTVDGTCPDRRATPLGDGSQRRRPATSHAQHGDGRSGSTPGRAQPGRQ